MDTDSKEVQVYRATPKDPDAKDEERKWEGFWKLLGSLFGKGSDLSRRVAEAKVREQEAAAEKLKNEAKKAKHEATKEFFKLLDDLYNPDIPEAITQLKLATLLAENPEIYEMYNKVEGLRIQLQSKNVHISVDQTHLILPNGKGKDS